MSNRTFTMIKPDAVGNGHTGAIIDHIVKAGFKIVALKLTKLSTEKAGDFYGIPPTGRHIDLSGIYIVRIADGKIVEHWGEENGSEVLRQLGFKIKLEPVEKQQ